MKHLLILPLAATLALGACNSEDKAANVVEAVAEKTAAVTDKVAETAQDAVSSAKEVAVDAKDAVVDTAGNVKDAVVETAQDVVAPAFSTEQEKLGYAFGHQFARNLVASNLTDAISADAMAQAIKDSLSGAEPKMTDQEMQAAVQNYQTKLQAEAAAKAEEAKAQGTEFLAANKDKPGVVTTESGLQYIIEEEGKGATPTDDQSVEVNYKGTLIDGTVFDSSYDRGQSATFPLNGVIPGFTEGLKLMKEGGKIKLFIPSDLAYGVQAPPAIGPNQALIFEVELIAVQ